MQKNELFDRISDLHLGLSKLVVETSTLSVAASDFDRKIEKLLAGAAKSLSEASVGLSEAAVKSIQYTKA